MFRWLLKKSKKEGCGGVCGFGLCEAYTAVCFTFKTLLIQPRYTGFSLQWQGGGDQKPEERRIFAADTRRHKKRTDVYFAVSILKAAMHT